MRKLKAFLVLLFSVLMSLCLFACTPAEETPGPDDPEDPGITDPDNPPEEPTNQVISAQFQTDDPAITLSEAQVQDEASRLAAVEEAVSEFRIRYSIQGETRPVTDNVSDLKLEYDFSTVDWETVGAYSVTVTLVGAGEYDCGEGVVLSNTLSLSIEHSFGEPPVNGSATCEFCGAVMTDVTLEEGHSEKVSIAGFHAGATVDSSSGDLELLTPFGTIEQGGEETEVLTATAGLLRKGMTISLYGTVQHQLANGEVTAGTDFYDYPNLGIALRDFSVSDSPFPVVNDRYVGGMSVIVRSDGWVLMDGIGENGNASYGKRLLAGLVGGANAASNYGSHTSAANTNVAWPSDWDYNNATPPADTSTWGDWAVYTSGTQADDTTYNNLQEVCYQFTFRNDNVVEIVYTIYGQEGAADSVLTCRIKIPDEYADVSFDTVIHGEFVDMNFNRMVIVEQDMLKELAFNGLGDEAKVNYLAGEVINYADFDGNVKVRYSSSEEGVWSDPDSYSIQVLRGEEWVTLGNSDRLLATDTDFRIMVRSGSVTLYEELELGADGFIQSITENNVTEVYGVGESASLGNVGFASNNAADAQVVISPVGAAVKDPDDLSQYIVLRVYGTFGETITAGSSIAEITVGEGYFDVKVATDQQTKTVTITGAQDTPIVIDVSGVTAPVYAVSYSIDVDGTAYDYIPANTGATVTFVYTVPTSVYADARIGVNTTQRVACTATSDLVATGGELRGGYAYTMSTTTSGDNTILTITIELPAYEVGGTGSVYVNFYTTASNLTTLYYGAPVAAEGSAVVEVGGTTGYFTVSGNTLYFVVVDTTNDIQASALTTGDVFMNINAGDASGDDFVPEIINVGSTYNAIFGSFDYKDADLAASGAVTATLTPNGTLNTDNAYDYDYNFVLTTAIDLAQFGITNASDFYFEYGKTDDDMHPVHLTVVDGVVTITPATLSETAVNIVAGGDCFTSSIDAYPVKDAEGNDLFYGNLTIIPAEHDWESDDGVIFTCSECGAITKNNGTRWTITPDMLAGVTETGLTVTMNTSGVTGDWNTVALASGQHNAIITLPNLDPFNMDTQLMTDEEKAIAETLIPSNFWPGAVDLYNGGAWNSFFNSDAVPSNFTTIVVEPGEEGGVSYYLNGVLVVKYAYDRQCNSVKVDNDGDGTAETEVQMEGTAGDYAKLFLMLVERTGLSIANAGITATDAVFYPKALTDAQIEALYGNNSIDGYYPVHEHSYETDPTADNYDYCVCGQVNPNHGVEGGTAHVADADDTSTNFREDYLCKVCGEAMPDHVHDYDEETEECIYCGAVNPNHDHVYEDDPESENYGYCTCGRFDPNHGTAEGTPHIFVDAFCTVCGAYDTTHTHTFVDGICVCGGRQISATIGNVTYAGEVSYTPVTNNDTDGGWWNGSTSSVALNDNTAVVFTWTNTRDVNYYDYAIEVVFNLGGNVDGVADGQYIDFDPTNQWSAQWISATAPTLSGTTTGTQATAGETNAGNGTFVATVVRVGSTVVVTVEFTATGSDTVTWTRTATASNCPTDGEPIVWIAGNPFFLDDIHAYVGTVSAE